MFVNDSKKHAILCMDEFLNSFYKLMFVRDNRDLEEMIRHTEGMIKESIGDDHQRVVNVMCRAYVEALEYQQKDNAEYNKWRDNADKNSES